MITNTAWAGRRYAVLGLARSGKATVRALVAGGADVVAWDGDEAKREALADAVQDQSSALDAVSLAPADPLTIDLTGFDGIVVSPGVPLNRHPIVAHARDVPIIGDIELFAQARAELPPHRVVGITGTNGKSTTTALIAHICDTARLPTRMGGNIGLPILAQEPLPAGGVYVLELSSYQIDLTYSLDCDVAVLLNITPDHLDRYDGFEAYAASKARLCTMQSFGRVAILGTADAAHVPGAVVIDAHAPLDQSRWPALQGPHNRQNTLAAIATARALGIDEDAIETALASFPGLPHRMERIATVNGVLWVNDSKATNPDSTAPALAAYPRVHWIVGGQAKTGDLDACRPAFGHVVRAYTIGEAGPMFAHLLGDTMPVTQAGTLAEAVAAAAIEAQPGDTVLLSPACASFDQFKSFEDRGDQFRALVGALS